EGGADRMLRVHQRGERGLGGVIPFAGRRLAAGVLGGGDDFEILVLQLAIDFLPTWQIEPAASPGRPRHDQHFLPAELRKPDGATLTVGPAKPRGSARLTEPAAQHRNLAEAPNAGVRHVLLPDAPRETGEVEPLAILEILGDRNTDIGAAGALRLQLELIN